MKRFYSLSIIVVLLSLVISCSLGPGGKSPGTDGSGAWLVPIRKVFDSGPGKDGIPALENPEMITSEAATFLAGEKSVAGVLINGEARAYPLLIMEHHEIANVEIGGRAVSVTFCPLTYSSIGWDRTLNGTTTTFGVSGFLYKNNLVPYDRLTDSNWSQMLNLSVNGDLISREIETFQVVETKWSTWKRMYPETLVLSTNTGFNRNYGPHLYGNYETSDNNILFPITNDDFRLPRKDRLHGIIVNSQVKTYPFTSFPRA